MSNSPSVADQSKSSLGKRLQENSPFFILMAIIAITVVRYFDGAYSDWVLVPPLVLLVLWVVYSTISRYILPWIWVFLPGSLMWCVLLAYETGIDESQIEKTVPAIFEKELIELSQKLSQAIDSVKGFESNEDERAASVKRDAGASLPAMKENVDQRIGPLFDNFKLVLTSS